MLNYCVLPGDIFENYLNLLNKNQAKFKGGKIHCDTGNNLNKIWKIPASPD